MRMIDLDPKWLRYEKREDGGIYFVPSTMPEAHGIRFLCPKCFAVNGGPSGTHSIICWSRARGTPEEATPGPGRWTFHGTGFEDLTFEGDPVGTARSVQLNGGCNWHGHVTNGEVI
jgi:hypothetical protein